VAARLCVAATGTDTGGSIRQPAAFCGLTGIKPTYGTISRFGMIAFASSLDQAGPMAKSAEDAALLLDHMLAHDPKDSTSVTHPKPHVSNELNASLEGLKVGLPKEYFRKDLDPSIAKAILQTAKQLETMGATLVDISLQHTELAVPCYYIIAPAEASSNLSRYDGVRFGHRAENPKDLNDLYCKTRSEGFGEEVKRRIMLGTYALSSGYYDAYYVKAQKVRRMIKADFDNAFKTVDVILSTTTPSTAFELNSDKSNNPVQMYLNDLYTIAVNLAGLPALSMPCGFINNLPVGAQLIGPHFSESKLLNVAHRYQQETDHHKQMPSQFEGGLS
jgi:aspartyl-tRNA(Asn)/glutamyl-tRNA(Gln) amidotransferase subunit A